MTLLMIVLTFMTGPLLFAFTTMPMFACCTGPRCPHLRPHCRILVSYSIYSKFLQQSSLPPSSSELSLLYPNLFRAQAATLTKLRGAQKRARPLPAATLPGHSGLSPECRIRARLWIFSTEASQILAGTLVKSGGARQPA
ncbi:hypothetical protein DFH94DRAFT_681428 [Russula ochroleuca]|uniref:Secreted protein n=1 Tax=Russula ochroleuca TaxID=152965 RepID=A0A9P5MWW7_9AGAM|nr:hypothetical protein DFH94DRAFT_681428 [Russula ochroleuca]